MASDKWLNKTGLSYLITKVKNLLSSKVDKVDGKSLSANDFTDANKTSVSNYDDGQILHHELNPTATTYYGISFHGNAGTEESKRMRTNGTLRVNASTGTAEAEGVAGICLGNSTPTGTAGNATGRVQIYSDTAYQSILKSASGLTANKTIYLPDQNGTLATTDEAKLVTQTATTSSAYRPVVMGYNSSSSTSVSASTVTNSTYTSSKMYANPSNGYLYGGNFYSSANGLYLTSKGVPDGSASIPAIIHNGSTLWVGGSAVASGAHHTGGTYISTGYDATNDAGYESIYACVPKSGNNSSSAYKILHTGNYKNYVTPESIGASESKHTQLYSGTDTTAKSVTLSSDNTNFDYLTVTIVYGLNNPFPTTLTICNQNMGTYQRVALADGPYPSMGGSDIVGYTTGLIQLSGTTLTLTVANYALRAEKTAISAVSASSATCYIAEVWGHKY